MVIKDFVKVDAFMSNRDRRLNILLLEDSARRLKLVRIALEQSKTRCRLHSVSPGMNALQYLRQETPYQEAPTPDLVLFDFSDANPQYLTFVTELRGSEEFRNLPFAVLTRPESEVLLEETLELNGENIVFSPIELSDFLRTMNARRADRFVSAVSLVASFGFVLIRAPEEFSPVVAPDLTAHAM